MSGVISLAECQSGEGRTRETDAGNHVPREGWGELMRMEATVRTHSVSRSKDAKRDISERCGVTATIWESTGRSGQMP